MEKQSKNIAKLRKQIAAYSSGLDTSEEAKTRLQQLKVQLEEAEESRADMEYQRRLQDQRNLLDQMYQSLEDYFEDKLSDTDKILEESKKLIASNMPDIKTTLNNSLKFNQTQANISNTLTNILNSNLTSVGANLAKTDGDISALKDSVTTIGAELAQYYQRINEEQENRNNLYSWISNLNDLANGFFGKEGSFNDFLTKYNDGVYSIISAIDEEKAEEYRIFGRLGSSGDSFFSGLQTMLNYKKPQETLYGLDAATNPGTKTQNVTLNTTISLDNVTDYKSFIAEAKRDKSFEKYLQEVTINQLNPTTSSALRKYTL